MSMTTNDTGSQTTGSGAPAERPLVIHSTTSTLIWADRFDHWQARWAIRRMKHKVQPGVYALGRPGPSSPVLVTANYSLSFDALRSALAGRDAYILVLNTRGINVWCAAGKGTFGTGEIATRVKATGLDRIVSHRRLILPQLGAPGVSAQEVSRRTGFTVEYGPVRAADLPAYLDAGHQATPEMRRVRFSLAERLTLVPVEVVQNLPRMAVALVVWALCGWTPALAAFGAVFAGAALFPLLLPLLPSRWFSVKGFVLGGLVAAPFAVLAGLGYPPAPLLGRAADLALGAGPVWLRLLLALAIAVGAPPVTAYLSLNFTGSTVFTSRTGVKREIATYVPVMAWLFGAGILLLAGATIARAVLR